MRLAKTAPALRSLIDPDDPRFLNPPDMPVAIQEFCRETGQPIPKDEGALVRCALESLALKYQFVLSCLEELSGNRIETIHVVGGGSKNDLLNQFTADACDRQVVAGPVEATALGNLLTQARACGEIGSLSELRAIIRKSSKLSSLSPASKSATAWNEARARFAAMLPLTKSA